MRRRNFLGLTGFTLGLTSVVKHMLNPAAVNSSPTIQSQTTINIAKDFTTFFQDGSSFKFDYQDSNLPPRSPLQTITISVREIGNLAVTSGKLIACDPLLEPDLKGYFAKIIPPGQYPVILSIAELQPRNETRIAYAMLRLNQAPIVKWELAVINGQHPRESEGEIYGYGVDSGTGSFMDWDAAKILYDLANPNPVEYEAARKIGQEKAWELSSAALDRFEREFCDKVILAMNQNKKVGMAYWANHLVNDTKGGNIIAFSSGWGDGGYSSYWGYDAKGNIAALVTDFMLLHMNED
jgi:hypothetical protein